MKKTAIFLVFTLLLVTFGGMTTVFAANSPDPQTEFIVDGENGLVIYGNQFTASPTMEKATDGFFNDTGTYKYTYLTNATYAWLNYDLKVDTPQSYRVTAWVNSQTDSDKKAILELSRMGLNKTAGGRESTTNIADVKLASAIVPNNGIYSTKEIVDLGIIDLMSGTTTIGIKNVGEVTCYLHNITLTPVDDDIIYRERDDYSAAEGTSSNLITENEDDILIFHGSTPTTLTHKIYVPADGTYRLSLRYKQPYASIYNKVKVSVGKDVEGTITYTDVIPSYNFTTYVSEMQYYDLGMIDLTAGEQYIKFTAVSGDFYISSMRLEKAESADFIEVKDGIGILYNEPNVTAGTGDGGWNNKDFEYTVYTDEAGTYDVKMNIYPSGASYQEQRFLFTVNGVEQGYNVVKTPSGAYTYQTIGQVTLPQGYSTVKVTTQYAAANKVDEAGNIIDGYNYASIFNYNKLALEKTQTIINASDRADTSTTTDVKLKNSSNEVNGVKFAVGNTATFTVNAEEAGIYDVSIMAAGKSTGDIWTVSANGSSSTVKATYSSKRLELAKIGNVVLKQGTNEITLSLDKGLAADVKSLHLTKKNIVKLYRDSVAVKNEFSSIDVLRTINHDRQFTSGKLIAQADLSAYAGKEVLCVFAVYNANNQLANVGCTAVTATASTLQNIEVTGVTLAEGYTAKVFIWDEVTLFGSSEVF